MVDFKLSAGPEGAGRFSIPDEAFSGCALGMAAQCGELNSLSFVGKFLPACVFDPGLVGEALSRRRDPALSQFGVQWGMEKARQNPDICRNPPNGTDLGFRRAEGYRWTRATPTSTVVTSLVAVGLACGMVALRRSSLGLAALGISIGVSIASGALATAYSDPLS